MTQAQRFMLFIDAPKRNHVSLWSRACALKGWDKADRAVRLQFFSQAVGRPLASSSDLGNAGDVTKVKKALEAIVFHDDLNRQMAGEEMARTNLLTGIRQNYSPHLIRHLLVNRFTFAVWLRTAYPEHAGKTVSVNSKRGPAPADLVAEYRISGAHHPTLDELNEEELIELRNTLARQSAGAGHQKTRSEDPDWTV